MSSELKSCPFCRTAAGIIFDAYQMLGGLEDWPKEHFEADRVKLLDALGKWICDTDNPALNEEYVDDLDKEAHGD